MVSARRPLKPTPIFETGITERSETIGNMNVTVAGSGIGGMLTAAKLAREGYDVTVFEKNRETGGRFRNLEQDGFHLSSGAFHMLPHGATGPVGLICADVGADVNIVQSDPPAVVQTGDGTRTPFPEYCRRLLPGPGGLVWYPKLFWGMARGKNVDYITGSEQSDVRKVANAFLGWSISMRAEQLPVSEMWQIFKKVKKYGLPGIPEGGCSGLIDALADVVREEGGDVYISSPVETVREGEIEVGGAQSGTYEYDHFVSNVGHKLTADLMGDREYRDSVADAPASPGVKIALKADEPLVGHSGILLTPDAERINGINEVSQADPSLAPEGKHLTMAHQFRDPDTPMEEVVAKSRRDLERIFEGKEFEFMLVQAYENDWPVNRVSNGTHLGQETPMENAYVVGDGAKEPGGIEVEGIGLGVEKVIESITGETWDVC